MIHSIPDLPLVFRSFIGPKKSFPKPTFSVPESNTLRSFNDKDAVAIFLSAYYNFSKSIIPPWNLDEHVVRAQTELFEVNPESVQRTLKFIVLEALKLYLYNKTEIFESQNTLHMALLGHHHSQWREQFVRKFGKTEKQRKDFRRLSELIRADTSIFCCLLMKNPELPDVCRKEFTKLVPGIDIDKVSLYLLAYLYPRPSEVFRAMRLPVTRSQLRCLKECVSNGFSVKIAHIN